jgi:mRNA interferase MazF
MYKRGDIVLIPIPYTDLSTKKKRPVLIISSDEYNRGTEDFIVAAITSNIDDKAYSIKISSDDLSDGILLRTSCIRTDKLYTLSQSIAIRKFGAVKEAILNRVTESVIKAIDASRQTQLKKGGFNVQLAAEDLTAVFNHYRRAFNAKLTHTAKGSQNELIHLEMDVMGGVLSVAPYAAHEINKGNVTRICIKFNDKDSLINAYNVLCEDGCSEGLKEYPWSVSEGYVTDKFGVVWCIGL